MGGDSSDGHDDYSCSASWPGEFACLDLAGITVPLSLTVGALVIFALFFEHVIHKAIHAASHDRFWRDYVAAMLAELSMLGLISFTLFLVSQMATLSDDMFHLTEFVHLTLFMMMMIYYTTAAWIARSSKKILNSLGDYENLVYNFDLVECISELKTVRIEKDKTWWIVEHPKQLFFGLSELDKRMQLNAYLLTRYFFLTSQGLPSDLPFDYAEYVDRCTSALCVKLVQVGWRTWVGILIMTGVTTGVALLIDISDGTLDQLEEMWADSAAVNQNYFWSMFFLGWVLYLINGLIWAGFERSRAALILLTARKEATGSNIRSSRFDPSPSFMVDDNQSIHSEQSSIGNVLRSTVSRDWSRGHHPSQKEAARMRKDTANAFREVHSRPIPNQPPATVAHSRPSRLSTHSHLSTNSHLSAPSISSNHSQHQQPTHQGEDHRSSWEKTERSSRHKFCPCLFETDEWRQCFPMTAPEFPLRVFQAILLFFSLFLALCFLVFYHIDPTYSFFSAAQPFLYLYMFGLNQLPFYATLRFFGPKLAKASLVDDLVYFAQELQLEEYRNNSCLPSEAAPHNKNVNPRASTIVSSSSGTTVHSTTLDASKPLSQNSQSARPTDLLTPSDPPPSEPPGALLRGWGDSSKPIYNPNPSHPSTTRISVREPTIIEDGPEEELGGLLRGWGEDSAPSYPTEQRDSNNRQRDSSNWSFSNHRLSFRRSHLSKDTHLEAMIKRQRHSDGSPGQPAPGVSGLNTSTISLKRRSFQKQPSLLTALRLSESRISSRCSKNAPDDIDDPDNDTFGRKYKSEAHAHNPSGNLLSPLMEDEQNDDVGGGGRSADLHDGVISGTFADLPHHNLRHGSLHREDDGNEYASMEVLEEVCKLLSVTSAKKFTQVAIFRVFMLGVFFFIFLTTDCEVEPGKKLQCTWLDII